VSLSDQLYRAIGSISANVAEGYSRRSSRDQARFYEYALGSAREARIWYYQGRHVLSEAATMYRLRLLSRIVRLLLTIILPSAATSWPKNRLPIVLPSENYHNREDFWDTDFTDKHGWGFFSIRENPCSFVSDEIRLRQEAAL
jgi:four helix bundle protein